MEQSPDLTTHTAPDAAVDSSRLRRSPLDVARGVASFVPVALVLAAVLALSFRSGGYILERASAVVFVVAVVAVVCLWLAPRLLLIGWPVVVGLSALAAFALWECASIAWSIGPDLSWIALDFTLLYLLVAALVFSTPADRRHLRLAGYGYVVVAVPVAVFAFLGKVLPDVVTHAHTFARLSDPVGYWNVLALMLGLAVAPAIHGASRHGMPIMARAAFAAALALLWFTLIFTFSRGGMLALAIMLAVYFALTTSRLAGLLTVAAAALPVGAALYRVRGLDSLFTATTNDAVRTSQGHAFGHWALVAIVGAFVLQLAVALAGRRVRLEGPARRIVGALVGAAVVLTCVAAGSLYVRHFGGASAFAHAVARQFTGADSGGTSGNDATRLLSIGNNGRISLAREGLRQFPHHPLAGTGAGTFRFTNYLYRDSAGTIVKHAHNQWVNVLSELGVVGLALFVITLAALLVAALRPVGRVARDADRGLLAALQAGAIGFTVHLTVDWDWDMAAVTLVFLLFAGVAAAYARGRAVERAAPSAGAGAARPRVLGLRLGIAGRVFITGAIMLMVVSWVLPFLAVRSYDNAVTLASGGHITEAIAATRHSMRLDPMAVDPLITLGLLQQQQGASDQALATLQKAVRLQPQNYLPYYQLGMLQLDVFGLKAQARASFARALALNPHDSMSQYGLSLAQGSGPASK